MEKKLCVYTCITGDYDNLHEIETPEKNIDYLCFTNNKSLKSKTWKIIYINNDGLDDHHLSRKIKMLGHPIISRNYQVSLWMDASVIWKKSITDFVSKYYKNQPFSAIKHSLRNSIHEEAIACLQLHKDSKTNILKTLSFLESENFPDNLGLYEMAVFIKNHNDPNVIKAMELWFEMNQKYSKRDQLSFMYVIWKTGLQVHTINLNVWDNQWFMNNSHKAKASPSSFSMYFGEPDDNSDLKYFFNYSPETDNKVFKISQIIPRDCEKIYINFPYARGLIVKEINYSSPINQYEIINATPFNKDYIFLSGNGTIILHGSFKQNKPLNFSIKLQQINYDALLQYAETISIAINTFKNIKQENMNLKNENEALRNELDSQTQILDTIKSSKSWKIIQKIKKILPPYKH